MRSTSVQNPWIMYKRYSDNMRVEARLIVVKDEKLMEVKQQEGQDFVCPCCKTTLSEGNKVKFPNAMLQPKIFHERHRPV